MRCGPGYKSVLTPRFNGQRYAQPVFGGCNVVLSTGLPGAGRGVAGIEPTPFTGARSSSGRRTFWRLSRLADPAAELVVF